MRNGEEMAAYFGRIAAERRTQGAEDLVTALVEAEVDGERLAEPELLGFCILLLVAGNETTTNLIGNLLNLLAARPDLWRRLRENRTLVEGTIEEVLRYESPVQVHLFARRAPAENGLPGAEAGGPRPGAAAWGNSCSSRGQGFGNAAHPGAYSRRTQGHSPRHAHG